MRKFDFFARQRQNVDETMIFIDRAAHLECNEIGGMKINKNMSSVYLLLKSMTSVE